MKMFSEKLPFNFKTKKPLEVKFSGLDLSTDAGLLLLKQGEENWKVCQGIADCLEDKIEQHNPFRQYRRASMVNIFCRLRMRRE